MTLHEVRQYLQTLYSSSSDSSENKIKRDKISSGQSSIQLAMPKVPNINNNNRYSNPHTDSSTDTPISNKNSNGLIHNNNNNGNIKKHKKVTLANIRHKKPKEESHKEKTETEREKIKKSQRNFSLNLKQTLCNIFRFRRLGSPEHYVGKRNSIVQGDIVEEDEGVDFDQHANNNNTTTEVDPSAQKLPFFKRALPPLPKTNGHIEAEHVTDTPAAILSKCESPSSIQHLSIPHPREEEEPVEDTSMDFAASIEKVKDVSTYCLQYSCFQYFTSFYLVLDYTFWIRLQKVGADRCLTTI